MSTAVMKRNGGSGHTGQSATVAASNTNSKNYAVSSTAATVTAISFDTEVKASLQLR